MSNVDRGVLDTVIIMLDSEKLADMFRITQDKELKSSFGMCDYVQEQGKRPKPSARAKIEGHIILGNSSSTKRFLIK